MSSELAQELNRLRIQHGTSNVYKTLLSMMRREYEELSEMFTGSYQNSNPIVPSSDYYNEFMMLNNRAMAETLEEQCYNLHEIDLESIPQEEDVDCDVELDIMDDVEEDIGFYGFGEEGLGETEAEADVKIISTEDRSSVATSVDKSPKPDIKEIITEPHPIVKGRGKRVSKKKD
jgi:hypothetical protein